MKGERRRVFVVTPFENRLAARSTRLPKLAEMLVAAGHDVEYVTTDFSHAYKRKFTREEIEEAVRSAPYRLTVLPILGYRHNISTQRVVSNFLMAVRHFIYLSSVMRRGNVLVLPSRPVEMIACAAALKRSKGVYVVVDIRDAWPDALVTSSRFHKVVFWHYCNLFLRPSLKELDRFVHIVPSMTKWLERYAPHKRSVFLPHGFDAERWAECRPHPRKRDGVTTLVFVGALQRQLDVMPVVRAVARRPSFRFLLVGDNGTGERYREVAGFIEKHRVANVTLLGAMKPEGVVEVLKGADVGVFPMLTPGMPNKLFDYIASYTPVLSLGDQDGSAFVKEHGIGWTAPFDHERVGEVLDQLTPDELEEKGRNVARIRPRFDRDVLYRTFVDIIEGVGLDEDACSEAKGRKGSAA